MKATELMIGNWVRCRESSCQGHRVDFVNEVDGEVGVDGEILNLDMVYPIPLTPEILEKNGWKSYSHENTPIFGTIQGFEIVLAWMDYYWQLCVDGTVYRKIKIRYVNELQHALKLCGIEKEIIEF